ncbi:ClpP/crotonase [Penicillium waksmanii]|uniref:ClpP/crotonase n=1 Tax=Penicillium waksmanii TaxID=69791 RepID=UPI0025484357|nr:ClpP/crotonase [Penicillium waksmanii]KAJ5989532.1 ClpP/crotonase [Penicillium waksmanii]
MTTGSSYPSISANLDLRGEQYQSNKEGWTPILDKFEDALKQVSVEGNDASLLRHQRRGQLLHQDSPFLEVCAFAGYENSESTPGANIIAGIGNVCGKPCFLLSHVPTSQGGAWNSMTVLKVNRCLEIATENDLPLISLVQSAGVFLPQQRTVFHKGGQLFYDLAQRSAAGKPSCAIVFGSSTAGGAYHPALSDYTIFVENQGQAFLGGPPLVKMATGEVIEAEELGGAKVHATMTGLADQIATDEFDAIQKSREWVASLQMRTQPTLGLIEPAAPRYPVEDLLSLVNPDIRKPFDMSEVLLRLVDDSRLSTFKPKYGPNIITAWAHIMGHPVGIVANQISVINPTEAAKAAAFIRICNQQNTPIVFLHNVTGFMVGAKAEHAGIIKMGAQLVSAVSCSKVPHISIILRSVLRSRQLRDVREAIQAQSAQSKGKALSPEKLQKQIQTFRDTAQRDAESYSTSSSLIDDGIIDPRDTRDVLGICLEVVSLQGVRGAESHMGLARI